MRCDALWRNKSAAFGMSSPVFHGLTGAGLAYVMAGDAHLPLFASLRKAAPLLIAGAILACLPDVDYLPGLMRGALNTAHQGITHSLAWVLLVTAGLWLVGRAWKPGVFGWRVAAFLLIVIGSHLVIDLVTVDHLAPYGIPLWAPLSWRPVQGPVSWLPAWEKSTLLDLLHARNLISLAIELGAGLLVAAVCIVAKRGWTRRNAAL